MIKISEAKQAAKLWVKDNFANQANFIGAYLTGSTIWKHDEELHAACSDVDIFVVFAGGKLPDKLGKITHQGLTLEINFIHLDAISDTQKILQNYHIANAFYRPSILLDPWGKLAAIHHTVSSQFSQPQWVMKRCQDARDNAQNFLNLFKQSTHLHDQVTSLFFAAGVTCHILLVAGLQNPTIRRRYVACHLLLNKYGEVEFHQRLLTTLGSQDLEPQIVAQHLEKLDTHFTVACQVMNSPYAFAADMNIALKPIAIGGVQEMIDQAYHREAIFWLVTIFCRSRAVIYADGTAEQLEAVDADLWALLTTLGIQNLDSMHQRATVIEKDLDVAWQLAQNIIAKRQ